MLKINKTISVYGTSSIDVTGNETIVAQMNASINSENKGSVNINISIINTELYFENRADVDQDIEDFNNYVYVLAEMGGLENEQ